MQYFFVLHFRLKSEIFRVFLAMPPTDLEGGTTPELVVLSSKIVSEQKGSVSILFFNELLDVDNEGSNLF